MFQLILKADSGIDYSDFFNLLCHIASTRLTRLKESTCMVCNTEWCHSNTHDIFDVMQIMDIVEDMLQDAAFSTISLSTCPKDLYSEMKCAIKQYFTDEPS